MSDNKNSSDLFQKQNNSTSYLDLRIAEVQKHFEERIESLKEIKEKYFQLLCLFALLESLAQEYSNYAKIGEQKKFTSFVLEFQNKWEFLQHSDPVTLYYDVHEHLDDDINLDFLIKGNVYTPVQIIKTGMTDKIVDCLKIKNNLDIEKYKRKHRYVDLLYKMRSKLSHELSTSGSLILPGLGESEILPFYMSVTRLYNLDGEPFEDNIWELTVPVEFIEELLINCLENYLKFCMESQRDPFENNKFERKFRLAWYD